MSLSDHPIASSDTSHAPSFPRLLGGLILMVGLAAPGSLTAQEDTPKDRDPIIEQALEQLEDAMKDRKAEEDGKAVNLLNTLKEKARKPLHPKDLKDMVKDVYKVFFAGPIRPAGKDQVYKAAAETLSTIGTEGAQVLMKVVEHGRFSNRDHIALKADLLEEIGKGGAEEPKIADYLLDVAVRSPEEQMMASAGKALGNYDKADIRVKREIVEKLIDRWGALEDQVRTAPIPGKDGSGVSVEAEKAKDQLRAVRSPWRATLQKLTGQTWGSHEEWQRWQNKNKRWQ